jgi:hypothetical protein
MAEGDAGGKLRLLRNGLGPEYNAAHANHFHLGMRGFGSAGEA